MSEAFTPWKHYESDEQLRCYVRDSIGFCVATTHRDNNRVEHSDLIIRCVNAHDVLLAACEAALKHCEKSGDADCDCELCEQLRAAIAAAKP